MGLLAPGHYARSLVGLTLGYVLDIADHFLVRTLSEPIRRELGLSNSGIAFLTGVSLALFYVTVGIPIAVLMRVAGKVPHDSTRRHHQLL